MWHSPFRNYSHYKQHSSNFSGSIIFGQNCKYNHDFSYFDGKSGAHGRHQILSILPEDAFLTFHCSHLQFSLIFPQEPFYVLSLVCLLTRLGRTATQQHSNFVVIASK